MRIYSHRGNTAGIGSDENKPEKLAEVAQKFFVEIDVWFSSGDYYLGHDEPRYKVDKFFLFNEKFLLHAKNPEAFFGLSKYKQLEVFFQHGDAIAVSTHGHQITHSDISDESFEGQKSRILVSPNAKKITHWQERCFGLVTDYPEAFSTFTAASAGAHFDLLILDIDGVMTSGKKTYDRSGETFSKDFLDRDFTAIKRFINAGVSVVFLSGDKNVNQEMASKRGIDFIYGRSMDGNIDKELFLEEMKTKYSAKRACYVGDDYFDLTLLAAVDVSVCPADAAEIVKNQCEIVTKSRGGEGVVAELFEIWKTNNQIFESYTYDSHK